MSAYAPQPGKAPWVGAGVGAIIVDGDWVLLLKRTKEPEAGCWGIQGGAIEFGETTEEAARRELREELGVECEIVRLLGITDHILPGEGIHWISPVFLAKLETGTPKDAEPEKHSEMRWFDLEDLPERTTLPTKNAIYLLREHFQ